MAKTAKQLSHEEFVRRAVTKLRNGHYKGIHSVYSGFNGAFRKYYGEDPVEAVKQLAARGKIVTRPTRGGVMLYLPEDMPRQDKSEEALTAIIG